MLSKKAWIGFSLELYLIFIARMRHIKGKALIKIGGFGLLIQFITVVLI